MTVDAVPSSNPLFDISNLAIADLPPSTFASVFEDPPSAPTTHSTMIDSLRSLQGGTLSKPLMATGDLPSGDDLNLYILRAEEAKRMRRGLADQAAEQAKIAERQRVSELHWLESAAAAALSRWKFKWRDAEVSRNRKIPARTALWNCVRHVVHSLRA
jgi:hypothetical protein